MVQDKIQMCQHIPAAVTQPCLLLLGPFLKGLSRAQCCKHTEQPLQQPSGDCAAETPRAAQRELLLFRTAPGIEAAPQSGAELV